MDVPLVSSLPLAGVAGTAAVAPLAGRAADDAVSVAPLAPSLTTVDLSPLGRFLSASSLFQKRMVELQAASSVIPDSPAVNLGEVAAATTSFAVAFNELQAGSLDGTDADTGSAAGESLAGMFARQFGAETSAAGGAQGTALASLASIGLRFDTDPTLDPNARLTVDLPLLQVALEIDPATTTGLLERAGAAFGALVQAQVQPGDLSAAAQPSAAPGLPEASPPPGTLPVAAAPDSVPDETALPLPQAAPDPIAARAAEADAALAASIAQASRSTVPEAAANAPAQAPAQLQADRLGAADTQSVRAAPAEVANEAQPARLAEAAAQSARTVADNAQQARVVAAGLQDARAAAAGQALDAFERANAARVATPAALPDSGASVQELVNASSRAAVPAGLDNPAPAIPVTPPATAALPGTAEAEAQVAAQSAATPVTRPAADRELAERAFELAESRRSQSAYEQERAELAERIEVQDRHNAEQQKIDARAAEQQRQQRDLEAQRLAAGDPLAPRQGASTTVRAIAQDQVQGDTTVVPAAQPLPPPVNALPPSARDPAVAAAIAAYSLNTGPFAALNARPEAAAQRVKAVPAVSSVARVAPIETQTAPKGGTRQ